MEGVNAPFQLDRLTTMVNGRLVVNIAGLIAMLQELVAEGRAITRDVRLDALIMHLDAIDAAYDKAMDAAYLEMVATMVADVLQGLAQVLSGVGAARDGAKIPEGQQWVPGEHTANANMISGVMKMGEAFTAAIKEQAEEERALAEKDKEIDNVQYERRADALDDMRREVENFLQFLRAMQTSEDEKHKGDTQGY